MNEDFNYEEQFGDSLEVTMQFHAAPISKYMRDLIAALVGMAVAIVSDRNSSVMDVVKLAALWTVLAVVILLCAAGCIVALPFVAVRNLINK